MEALNYILAILILGLMLGFFKPLLASYHAARLVRIKIKLAGALAALKSEKISADETGYVQPYRLANLEREVAELQTKLELYTPKENEDA